MPKMYQFESYFENVKFTKDSKIRFEIIELKMYNTKPIFEKLEFSCSKSALSDTLIFILNFY